MARKGPRVLDPKRRIVRIRLSEREYRRLQEKAAKTGRTKSEILRAALREFLKDPSDQIVKYWEM